MQPRRNGAPGSRLFIVTELLHGVDLDRYLAEHPGAIPVDQAINFGIQLADQGGVLVATTSDGAVHSALYKVGVGTQSQWSDWRQMPALD